LRLRPILSVLMKVITLLFSSCEYINLATKTITKTFKEEQLSW